MKLNVDNMLILIRVCVVLAAIFTLAFPVLYAFSPWYKSWLGRALMIQAIAFANAVGLTAFYMFWPPESIMVRLTVGVASYLFIAGATGFLTWKLYEHNYLEIHRDKEPIND